MRGVARSGRSLTHARSALALVLAGALRSARHPGRSIGSATPRLCDGAPSAATSRPRRVLHALTCTGRCMSTSLRGRDFISAADLTADEVARLFARAAELKAEFAADRRHAQPPLERRTLAMLFQRPSLRTRVTFEAAMTQLGGHAIYLTEGIVLGGRESVADVARNLGRFVDGIMARTGPHEVVRRARRPGGRPRGQRADHPRAPVPDARRPVHAPRAVRGPSRAAGRVRRRRQQRLPLAGADGRDDGHGDPARPSARLRAERPHRGTRRASWPRPRAAGSCSTTIRGPSSGARRSSTRTRGRRWARRPRRRSVATRSRGTRSTTTCWRWRPTRS